MGVTIIELEACGESVWQCLNWAVARPDDVSHPMSMFQIPEFESSEQEDSPKEEAWAPGEPRGLGRHSSTAPCLTPIRPGHRPAAGTHHHEGAGASAGDRRPRLISYPPLQEGSGEVSPEAEAEAERSEGEEERGQFRSRSSSAPPILWAARRYGSELRRMSDEFDCTFKGLPRPKSAGTASQMRRSYAWTRPFQSWFGRNLGKGGGGPTH
ncbi:bcl2-associated agonist of cell death isoform X2 [Dromiciops gliroides]|uniref:bcl2-associated agonist of cell death isoform X2 n=1 Tax=Dromiciops gliroides TaxID=33562 RepID=UPI001CC523CC|nr:bcl2-associated agonist of cell death isoform X2 [Dromiciops gliroides]